jgi:hypothetical protein
MNLVLIARDVPGDVRDLSRRGDDLRLASVIGRAATQKRKRRGDANETHSQHCRRDYSHPHPSANVPRVVL